MVILENIDIDIDIDKAILQNIDIDKISNRFKFGISNRARSDAIIFPTHTCFCAHQGTSSAWCWFSASQFVAADRASLLQGPPTHPHAPIDCKYV